MKLPKSILAKVHRKEAMQRLYPENRPNHEYVTIRFEILALEGDPVGYLVSRILYRPSIIDQKKAEASATHDSYYEVTDIQAALEDFYKDTLPRTGPSHLAFQTPKATFKKPPLPRMNMERKDIPEIPAKKPVDPIRAKMAQSAHFAGPPAGISSIV